MSAEELFNMFFAQQRGAAFGGFQFNAGGQRVRMPRQQEQQQRGFANENNGRAASWMSFLPILFVVFVWVVGGLFSSNPAFALVQSHTHPVLRQTWSVERLEYFVERDFAKVEARREKALSSNICLSI